MFGVARTAINLNPTTLLRRLTGGSRVRFVHQYAGHALDLIPQRAI